MNVEEVRRMSAQLRDAAEEITRIEQELTSGLADVDWTGPDADRFRGQWQSEMVPALQQIMNSVSELGNRPSATPASRRAPPPTDGPNPVPGAPAGPGRTLRSGLRPAWEGLICWPSSEVGRTEQIH